MDYMLFDIPKSHQRKISDRKMKHAKGDMFGRYWEDIDTDLHKTEVKRINFVTARKIIEEHEWMGTMPLPKSCRFMYGIYFRNKENTETFLGGAEVFVQVPTQQFNKEYPREAVQLNRGACLFWTPRNTATYFISRCLNDLKKNGIKIVVAYCTQEAGEVGNIYQALSWDFVGTTPGTKMYWLDERWISDRSLSPKIAWAKKQSDSEFWLSKFKDLEYKTTKDKLKYVKIMASKKETEYIRELYGFFPMPYPKKA